MIAEDLLERGLQAAGDDYPVPDGAVDRIRAQLRPSVESPKRRRLRLRRPTARVGWLAVAAAAIGLVVGVPLALGGGGSSGQSAERFSSSTGSVAGGNGAATFGRRSTGRLPLTPAVPSAIAGSAESAPQAAGPVHRPSAPSQQVVKTGTVRLTASRGQVAGTLDRLTALATDDGGFVESSHSATAGVSPNGSVTLRVPVARFAGAVTAVSHLPNTSVNSVLTNGRDVTGQVVDLSARIDALRRTRATYLTILSHATSIGATLSIQDRISGVQTQIEQLQGQRKLLKSESAMSTLTVDVSQRGSPTPTHHQKRSGFGQAVHRSVQRFVRGIEAIVGIIGPLLLAVLIIAVLVGIGLLSRRLLRRRLV